MAADCVSAGTRTPIARLLPELPPAPRSVRDPAGGVEHAACSSPRSSTAAWWPPAPGRSLRQRILQGLVHDLASSCMQDLAMTAAATSLGADVRVEPTVAGTRAAQAMAA